VAVGSVPTALEAGVSSLDGIPNTDWLVLSMARVVSVHVPDSDDPGVAEGTGGPAGEEVVESDGRDEGIDSVVSQGCQDRVLEPVKTFV